MCLTNHGNGFSTAGCLRRKWGFGVKGLQKPKPCWFVLIRFMFSRFRSILFSMIINYFWENGYEWDRTWDFLTLRGIFLCKRLTDYWFVQCLTITSFYGTSSYHKKALVWVILVSSIVFSVGVEWHIVGVSNKLRIFMQVLILL